MLLLLALLACNPDPSDSDTGDTGDSGDTDDSGDTGDTTDSGDSADTGDTGDTAADTGDTAADTGDTAADTGDTAIEDPVLLEELLDTAFTSLGDDTIDSFESWAFAITPGAGTVTGVDLFLQGPGAPSDALRVELHASGTNGEPSGSPLTIDASLVVEADWFADAAPAFARVDFPAPIPVQAATVYWIVMVLEDEQHSNYTFPVYNTGVANQLAWREQPSPNTWAIYDAKTYDVAHRVWGHPAD